MKHLGVAFFALVTLVSASAIAQDFAKGVEAFQKGDYQSALRNWMPLAEAGDADSQRNIGVMFQQEIGVERSTLQAAEWYLLAAEQGHARAQQNLGVLYEEGEGVPQSYTEAAKWYLRAAEGGNVIAKLNLGLMLEVGVPGLPINVVEAHMWFNIAASQGNSEALELRDRIAAEMSNEQVALAQSRAQEWLQANPHHNARVAEPDRIGDTFEQT